MVYFIKALPRELPQDRLEELDTALGLSISENAEIGRTRFIEPVYRALAENGHDAELVREIFDISKGG